MRGSLHGIYLHPRGGTQKEGWVGYLHLYVTTPAKAALLAPPEDGTRRAYVPVYRSLRVGGRK